MNRAIARRVCGARWQAERDTALDGLARRIHSAVAASLPPVQSFGGTGCRRTPYRGALGSWPQFASSRSTFSLSTNLVAECGANLIPMGLYESFRARTMTIRITHGWLKAQRVSETGFKEKIKTLEMRRCTPGV